MFDMVTDVKRISAMAALVQAATAFYQEEYLQGATRSKYNQLFLEQNEWSVSRNGLEAILIDPESGERISCQEQIDRLMELVTPKAKELGSEKFLARIKKIQKEGTEADWQRRYFAENDGDLRALELEIACRTCLY
jgi:gamma-glutamyl:cysteine ligase YbdK (ATP-grasp superfamily)